MSTFNTREMSQGNHSVIQPIYDANGLLAVDYSILEQLRNAARLSELKRSRLCAHRHLDDRIHEMLIGFCADSYVRPHRHSSKIESFHVIEGIIEVVVYDDAGTIKHRQLLGALSSGYPFYFRADNHDWHSVLVHSEFALVHETTNGPFNASESEFASWSPEPADHEGVKRFMSALREQV